MFVKVLDSTYNTKDGELMSTGEIGKLLNTYLKEGKAKPTTIVLYELVPVDENKSKTKEETKKTGKKETPKKTAKKKAKKEMKIAIDAAKEFDIYSGGESRIYVQQTE